jgi:two-component system sensor histidine kinase KdpD
VLPALTAGIAWHGPRLALVDVVLLYLVAVICLAVLGGFWAAVLAAVASSLLLNWYFAPPLHTWVIDSSRDVIALGLFLCAGVVVATVVHRAARRAKIAQRVNREAELLLGLARTVLDGDDDADAVLAHLRTTSGCPAELLERVGERWVRVAGGPVPTGARRREIAVRHDLRLRTLRRGGQADLSARLLEGYGAQAAAALDRDRMRIKLAQSASLAEADRIRTALLTALSHDLRTPLASVKASVSTLRQTDVEWSTQDRVDLLATIEDGADQLDTLISNLLDMTRVNTGSLRPSLRPVSLDEVAPLVMKSLDDGGELRLDIEENLPLVVADAALLERVLANLTANAMRYSPRGWPPVLRAHVSAGVMRVDVVDHGPGVDDEDRERIFQPFQQIGNNRKGSGVGLGLAVAKGFVDAMGGRLLAVPTLGGGLTMRVELPLAATGRGVVRPVERTTT